MSKQVLFGLSLLLVAHGINAESFKSSTSRDIIRQNHHQSFDEEQSLYPQKAQKASFQVDPLLTRMSPYTRLEHMDAEQFQQFKTFIQRHRESNFQWKGIENGSIPITSSSSKYLIKLNELIKVCQRLEKLSRMTDDDLKQFQEAARGYIAGLHSRFIKKSRHVVYDEEQEQDEIFYQPHVMKFDEDQDEIFYQPHGTFNYNSVMKFDEAEEVITKKELTPKQKWKKWNLNQHQCRCYGYGCNCNSSGRYAEKDTHQVDPIQVKAVDAKQRVVQHIQKLKTKRD